MSRTRDGNLSLGASESFTIGDYRRVEPMIERIAALGIRRLRTPIHWPDYATRAGRAWYEWLLPALAARFELLPCLTCTDPGEVQTPPPDYLRLVDDILDALGAYCSAIEISAAPPATDRDPRLEPDGAQFADHLGEVLQRAKARDKQTVLAGTAACHGGWMELLGARGVLRETDAVGLQGQPRGGDLGGHYWPRRLDRMRELLSRHGCRAELWITETGFPTDGCTDRQQLRSFLEAHDAPAQRIYWRDVHERIEAPGCPPGLYDAQGVPRLLARTLTSGGIPRLRELLALSHRGARRNGKGVALITGGAGFIGTNLAARLLSEGRSVRLLDNLSRPGTERNLRWLTEQYGERLEFRLADVCDGNALRDAVNDAAEVYHFAAQVAVTTSLTNPLHDFEVNGRGTLNLLEALRRLDKPPPLVFTSTNKVYGGLDDLPLTVTNDRYELADPELRSRGVGEDRALAFCSPYGCSKGAADQYVLDYANTFSLPAAVLRMSCIYGPHQFGTEDQGWVAHFMNQALHGRPIVIYGDGRQVRDVLFVEDLVEAMLVARDRMEGVRGRAYNIGGGPDNTLSLRELLGELERMQGRAPTVHYQDWRASDQRCYVSDTTRFRTATGWTPRTGVRDGLARLHAWLSHQRPASSGAPAVGRVAL